MTDKPESRLERWGFSGFNLTMSAILVAAGFPWQAVAIGLALCMLFVPFAMIPLARAVCAGGPNADKAWWKFYLACFRLMWGFPKIGEEV